MKKIIGFALFILIIMFIIVGYSSNEVESSNQPNADNMQTNTAVYTDKLSDVHNLLQESIKSHNPTKNVKKKLQGQGQAAKDKQPEAAEKKSNSDIESQQTITNRKIDPQKPVVALTFDDGPHPKYTGQILNTLKKYNGLATFFVLGNRAEKYKSVVESIAADGNQIGNHTYDHKQLTKLSSQAITDEITQTTDIIQNLVNIKPGIMRPTYGSVNDNVKLNAGVPLILWSIDTLDWKTRNKKMIVNEVMSKVKDGDIVLMHDIYKTTAEAADVIIKQLSTKGYQLVTIDELYSARGIELVNGKVYANAH